MNLNTHCYLCGRLLLKAHDKAISNGGRVYHVACKGASHIAHGGDGPRTSSVAATRNQATARGTATAEATIRVVAGAPPRLSTEGRT